MRGTGCRRRGVVAAICAAVGLAGCGAKGEDPASTIGNIFAFNSTKAPSAQPRDRTVDVDCPILQVSEGEAAYRAYAGPEKTSDKVRYQFSFGDLSRECVGRGDTLTIRLGVSGYVTAGPAGGPGAFRVPLKIVVRRESDLQPALTRTIPVEATIAPGEGRASFAFVTEPLTLPLISRQADSDYSIYVGFDQGGGAAPAAPRKTARRRAR